MSDSEALAEKNEPSPPPARPRRRRWLRWTLLGLVLLLGLGAAGLTWVVHSESGVQWLLRQARAWLPGTLEVERLAGRLTGPLEVRGLKYQDGPLNLALAALDLDWQPGALGQGRLVLDRLTVQGVDLRLPPSPPAPPAPAEPAKPFAGLVLPVDIEIGQLAVKDVRVTLGDDPPLVIDRVELAARTQGRRVEINRLEAEALGGEGEIKGFLELAPALPLGLDLAWRYQVPEGPRLTGQGAVKGDLKRLEVHQDLAAPVEARIETLLKDVETNLGWDLKLGLTRVALGDLAPGVPADLSGELKGTGDLTQGGLDGTLTLNHKEFGRLVTELGAGYDAKSVTARQLKLTTPGGGQLLAQGHFTLADQSFAADLSWKELRWPLQGEAIQAASPQGRFQIQGRPTDYGLQVTAGVKVPQAPDLSIQAEGRGDLSQLALKQLLVGLPKGKLEATGEVGWAPATRWELKLHGTGLDPAIAAPDLPGNLNLRATTKGRLDAEGLVATVNLEQLDGRLRDYPLKGSGRVQMHKDVIELDQVQLASGSSRISANGSLGEQSDLKWDLKADDLASLWPGLAGRLQGDGRLQGKLQTPRLEARLQGGGIAYQGHKIGQLQGDAQVALDQDGRLDVNLTAKDLASGGQSWSRLALASQGRRSAHQVSLALEGKEVPTARLGLDGGLGADGTWKGRLTELELAEPKAGRWRLEKAAALTLGAEHLLVDALCLSPGQGRLCLSAKGNPVAAWQASLQTQGLSDAQVKPFLPKDLKLSAKAGLEAQFKGESGGRISGTVNADIPEGRLQFDTGGKAQTLDFSGTRLRVELAPKGGSADLKLPLAQIGELTGKVELPGLNLAGLDPKRQRLQGRLQARVVDLAFIAGLTPAVTEPKGRIEADFELGGTLATPSVKGRADLRDAALDLPLVGLKLRETLVRIRAENLDRLRYEASVRSGDGTIKLDGETRLQGAEGFPTQLRIKGENFTAADIPEARVLIAPDLTLSHKAQGTEVTGSLTVPLAKLKPRTLPASAVNASSDLVVVKDGKPLQDPAKASKLKARIRLILGDEVELEGFGLKGRLAGNLEVIDQPGRPVLGSGSLSIHDGTYRAYGQDLSIERGSVQFSESPVDNPGLDLRAVRKVDKITAGLRVSGSLRKPEMTLYSTPTMAQNAILSYLLTGQPPSASGALGAAASAALSGSGGDSFTDKIARWIGLEELRVETKGNMAGASVTTGSWLSPRLYLQYVNDLASSDPKLRLRYNVTKKFQIQTETGRAQGVDVLYTFER